MMKSQHWRLDGKKEAGGKWGN